MPILRTVKRHPAFCTKCGAGIMAAHPFRTPLYCTACRRTEAHLNSIAHRRSKRNHHEGRKIFAQVEKTA